MAPSIEPRRVAEIMISWLGLDLVSCTELQSLWAGYGHVCAVTARTTVEEVAAHWTKVCGSSETDTDTANGSSFRLILKLISPPGPAETGDEGHLRKMLSYDVEQYFYEEVAPQLGPDVHVATCLASTRHMDGQANAEELRGLTAMIMTDLRPRFPVAGEKRSVLRTEQVYAALDWLAKFHSSSWKSLPDALDEYLLPPLEEDERRRSGTRPGGRKLWLNGGYTYLATRRKEYGSLSRDKYSEWSAAFCSPVKGSSSVADMVADFLTPRGRPFETYIHGDVKSENLFTTELGDQVAFYDFQYAGLGLGVCDLAKLFTCSVPLDMLTSNPAISGNKLDMDRGEEMLLEKYYDSLLKNRPRERGALDYDWDTFLRHWETALVDWCRFQASWGFWGNTEWLESRVRSILADQAWRSWLQEEVRSLGR